MLWLTHNASPCADTVRRIALSCRIQGGQLQSNNLRQLGHSHDSFCTDLCVDFAAACSFARHKTQMLHVLGLYDMRRTSALTLI